MKKATVILSMKKYLSIMFFSLIAIMLSTNIAACGGDNAIEGSTWKGKMSWAEIDGEDDEDGWVTLTVSFTSDDSGNWSGRAWEEDDEWEDSENGTFLCQWESSSKGIVIIRRKKGKETLRANFLIKGNKMQLTFYEDHDYFIFNLTRQ